MMVTDDKHWGIMSKIANYLQSHLNGEVTSDLAVRKYYSTDASVLEATPALVVHPRSTNDIRKVVRFAWQMAEKGHVMPITPRGSGTDMTGAAIGSGAVMVFPAHLNKILELDTDQKLVRVQPGLIFETLQEALRTHGLFIPAYPASSAYSTVGGAIANNASGDWSLKYGTMNEWIDRLEVVLANGEIIQTGRISRREVEKKKGLATLEGEVYRVVDGLLDEYEAQIDEYYDKLQAEKDCVGYDLRDVRRRDGSIDLTTLFAGSQGTLGIVTEAILKAMPYNPRTSLLVAAFDSLDDGLEAIVGLRDLDPARLDMIDYGVVGIAENKKGVVFPDNLVSKEYKPAMIIFAEFDNDKRVREKKLKRAKKLIMQLTDRVVVSDDADEKTKYLAVREVTSAVVSYGKSGKSALPIINDVSVSFSQLPKLIAAINDLFGENHLEPAIWGRAGDANLRVYPVLDMSKLPDRQKVMKLMNSYYKTVTEMGGSIAGSLGDGRLKAPFVEMQVGTEMLQVFEKLKKGFDPHGVLNPGVKLGADTKQIVEMLRKDYSTTKFADYSPSI